MRIKAFFRIVFWTAAAIALTSFLVFTMSGESDNFARSLGVLRYDDTGYTEYAGGDDLVIPVGEVKAISVTWISGSVNISRCNDNDVTVSETSGKKLGNGQHLMYKLEEGTLFIKFTESRGILSIGGSAPSKRLEIGIPVSAKDALDSVSVDAVSAAVNLKGLTFRSLSAQSVSGKISLSSSMADRVSIETVSGSVCLDKDTNFVLTFNTTVGTAPRGVSDGTPYTCGTGGASVTVNTTGGNLTIE